MQLKDNTTGPPVKGDERRPPRAWQTNARTPGDIRRPFLLACDEWAEADRRHHAASVAVACGAGTAEALAAAERAETEALGRVLAARGDVAELLTAMFRAAMADACVRHSLMLTLLDLLRPALEPVADRLEAVETVVLMRGTAA